MNSSSFQESILDKVGLATLMIAATLTVVSQIALLLQ
jgi:hypothetical protein